jgi:lipid-A-disaccharide synthase
VVPTVEHLKGTVSKAVQLWPGAPIVVTGEVARHDTFATATTALAASGTVSVELALAGVPAVIAYDVNKVTAAIAKHLVKTNHVSLVNILLNRAAVPEYLLGKCRADLLAPAVAALLDDPEAREKQRQAYRSALDMLKPPRYLPSEVAADVVVGLIKQKDTE